MAPHASIPGERCTGLARRRSRRAHSLSPNLGRTASLICPDLNHDRHKQAANQVGQKRDPMGSCSAPTRSISTHTNDIPRLVQFRRRSFRAALGAWGGRVYQSLINFSRNRGLAYSTPSRSSPSYIHAGRREDHEGDRHAPTVGATTRGRAGQPHALRVPIRKRQCQPYGMFRYPDSHRLILMLRRSAALPMNMMRLRGEVRLPP
jgi:hypothetical protein